MRAWATDEPTWGIWGVPRPSWSSFLTRPVSTWSSSAVGRATSPPGSRGAVVAASGSTTPRSSSRPRGCSSASSTCRSRSCMPTPNEPRSRTGVSTSRSPSTARRSGATRTGGSRRLARLLRPGWTPRLPAAHSNLVMFCDAARASPRQPTSELLRDFFGMHRFEWPDEDVVEFAIPHGEMVRLLRRIGVRDRGSRGAQGTGRSARAVTSGSRSGVGAPVAERRGLEGPEDRVAASHDAAVSPPLAAASRRARS